MQDGAVGVKTLRPKSGPLLGYGPTIDALTIARALDSTYNRARTAVRFTCSAGSMASRGRLPAPSSRLRSPVGASRDTSSLANVRET